MDRGMLYYNCSKGQAIVKGQRSSQPTACDRTTDEWGSKIKNKKSLENPLTRPQTCGIMNSESEGTKVPTK